MGAQIKNRYQVTQNIIKIIDPVYSFYIALKIVHFKIRKLR
ncbi:hypothetical protein KPSA1_05533 [Pseudomonas syringae pv. actinidiae]|uniref:Uncharacterized protein n=1 Tax=Pseudomonas syringae pv. actinidiae TaxID=103796 RepID=A0A2V0QTY2_PSESF|nr:hypothetical protein KPSA1_05533 [Pseudomonas syringae pv. actinidiae]